MALRALMAKRKIDKLTETLAALEAKAEELKTRESELETAIAEADTEEEQAAVSEEVTAHETATTENNAAIEEARAAIEAAKAELAEIEKNTPAPAAPVPADTNERKVNTMPIMIRRFTDYNEQERSAFVAREEVRSWLGEMRKIIETRGVTGGEVITDELGLDLKDASLAQLGQARQVKITKENIPAATQLVAPDWIVRYMVENSLGRLWFEGHPNFDKSQWKYYLDEAPQEAEVELQLQNIRADYANMKPEDIKVIDPCMGSGHILVYAFDVLLQIYTSCGWSERDAAKSIIENNLFGLDIDDRAAQLGAEAADTHRRHRAEDRGDAAGQNGNQNGVAQKAKQIRIPEQLCVLREGEAVKTGKALALI